jgi:hypothetical protein
MKDPLHDHDRLILRDDRLSLTCFANLRLLVQEHDAQLRSNEYRVKSKFPPDRHKSTHQASAAEVLPILPINF